MKTIKPLIKVIMESKLCRFFSIYACGRLISGLVSVSLLPLFTKQLPQADFGIIGLLWLLVPLLSRAINLGFDVAVSLRYYKLSHADLSSYLYHSFFGILASGGLILLLGLWRIDWFQTLIDPSLDRWTFGLLIIAVLGLNFAYMMQDFLLLAGQAMYNVLVTVLMPVIVAVTTYYLILYVEPSYMSYITGMAIGYGLFGVIGICFFLINYPLAYFRPSLSKIKELLRVGLPVLPATVGGLILVSGDRYVIKYVLGLEAVAIYTYGYRFAEYVLLTLFQPFQKAFVPVILEKAAQLPLIEAADYNAKIVTSSLSLFILVVSGVLIPFKDVMLWISNKGYDDSYLIFLLSVTGILLYHTSQITTILLNHLERTELGMFMVIIGSVVNIGLNIWLIPLFGIFMAVVTTIVSYLLMLWFGIAAMQHYVSSHIRLSSILIRLLPFFIYVGLMYLTESLPEIWLIYIVKVLIYISLILMFRWMFEDVRADLSKIWLHLKIQFA